MQYKINKKDAQKVFKGRLIILLPAAFIGLFLGLFVYSDELGFDLLIKVALPISIIIIAGSIYLGMRLGMNKIINTVFVLNDESIKEETKLGKIKTIKIKEIVTLKENIFGLTINDSKNKIIIPKQLECYSDFKNDIKKLK